MFIVTESAEHILRQFNAMQAGQSRTPDKSILKPEYAASEYEEAS